jgi:hypothetical protein
LLAAYAAASKTLQRAILRLVVEIAKDHDGDKDELEVATG